MSNLFFVVFEIIIVSEVQFDGGENFYRNDRLPSSQIDSILIARNDNRLNRQIVLDRGAKGTLMKGQKFSLGISGPFWEYPEPRPFFDQNPLEVYHRFFTIDGVPAIDQNITTESKDQAPNWDVA